MRTISSKRLPKHSTNAPMSFWLFGQQANSASNLKRLLSLYYDQRQSEPQSLQQPTAMAQGEQQLASDQSLGQQQNLAGQPDTSPARTLLGSVLAGGTSTEQLDVEPLDDADIKLNRSFLWSILDDPSLLNELKHQNNKLVDFICFGYINEDLKDTSKDLKSDMNFVNGKKMTDEGEGNDTTPQGTISVLEVLVDLVIDSVQWFMENEEALLKLNDQYEPSNDDELEAVDELNAELNRIHVASEILSSNIWLISETLVEDALLSKLWTFLSCELTNSCPTIPLFVKINERLLESRPDQLLNFVRNQSNLVDLFLSHIDITIIMDLLLRFITTDKPDIPTGIIDILSDQELIEKLLDILQSETDSSTQSSCGDFLKALISLSANTSIDENTIGPNLLIKKLVSDKSVDKIIEIILARGSGVSTVVGVVIEIIRKNNSDYDPVNLLYTTLESHPPSKRDPIYLGKMLRKFSSNLREFNEILYHKDNTLKRIKNQIHQEIEPLGFERFKICELVAELLHCSNIGLLNTHLTGKIIEEREDFLLQQEDQLANALNDEIIEDESSKINASLNISNLNIGGTSEPSVALNSKNITISPNMNPDDQNGELPIGHIDDEYGNDLTLEDRENSDESSTPKNSNGLSKRVQLRSNPTVGDEFKIQLVDSKILQNIITMFSKFPWNNFWHNVVFDLIQQIFNGRIDFGYNSYLILELFESCDITNLIIDAYELCVKTEKEINVRLGYMGHLVLIAEEVVKFSSIFQSQKLNDPESDELIYNKLVDDKWIDYVTNILTETREQYNGVLGGIRTEEFEQSDYLNPNAIILGQTEEEIRNQPIQGSESDSSDDNETFYESRQDQNEENDNYYEDSTSME